MLGGGLGSKVQGFGVWLLGCTSRPILHAVRERFEVLFADTQSEKTQAQSPKQETLNPKP